MTRVIAKFQRQNKPAVSTFPAAMYDRGESEGTYKFFCYVFLTISVLLSRCNFSTDLLT